MKKDDNSKFLEHALDHVFDFVTERIGQIGEFHERYLIQNEEHSEHQAFICAGALQGELMDEFIAIWTNLQKILAEYGL
jgi:hypothetical protein